MDNEDVYAKVAREHPELTGRDRLYAIKELKQQQKAKQRMARKAGRECPACHDEVQPVTPAALQLLAGCLMLLALATFAASLVAAAHPFTDATVRGGWAILLWPAAAVDGWTHPRLLAVLLTFLLLYAAGWVLGKANERADRKARCPKCSQPMPPAPKS